MGPLVSGRAYYNEIDELAAAWLRELIKARLIADGEVDTRSIADVHADDLRGFGQCHFFAGIGGWSYALRLAGWPDDLDVWTGSCPCQPFSNAGASNGADDPRHVWPAWLRLIKKRRPRRVLGEQVASADGLGWLDRVSTDLEAEDYAVGSVDLGAPGVGAFHIRQRIWFVADRGMADDDEQGCSSVETSWLHERRARASGKKETARDVDGAQWNDVDGCGESGRMGNPAREGRQEQQWFSRLVPETSGSESRKTAIGTGAPAFWHDAAFLECSDGKTRPIEPGSFPLAYGVPGRVGRLRCYGNAIVPQVAAAFIEAYVQARS